MTNCYMLWNLVRIKTSASWVLYNRSAVVTLTTRKHLIIHEGCLFTRPYWKSNLLSGCLVWMPICCPILLIPLTIITVCILKRKENMLFKLTKKIICLVNTEPRRKSSLPSPTLTILNHCIVVNALGF